MPPVLAKALVISALTVLSLTVVSVYSTSARDLGKDGRRGDRSVLAPAQPRVVPTSDGPTSGNAGAKKEEALEYGSMADALGPEPLSAIAESISVRFQGFSDISGSFRLNEDDTISIPGIGRISVGSQTAAELEVTLFDRVLSVTGKRIPVAIEVGSYRSVFVTGEVRSPGPINWFRGLTVLKAVSAAGGMYRPMMQGVLTNGNSSIDEATKLTMLKLALALSRSARLKAELDGEEKIEIPERLIGLYGRQRAREFVAIDQTLLGSRNGSRTASLKAIMASLMAGEAEIARLNELEGKLSKRLKRVSDAMSDLSEAYKNKVITRQRLIDSETLVADLDERTANTRVLHARAVATTQELERERVKIEETPRATISEQLANTWADIEQLQLQLDGLRKNAPLDLNRTAEHTTPVTYELIRRSSRTSVQEFDDLRPGDTLIIKKPGTQSDDGQGIETSPDDSNKPKSSIGSGADIRQPRS